MPLTASLRARFDTLWSRAVGAGDPIRPWRRLAAGYGDAGRAYHGWSHVAAMLAEFDGVRAHPEFASLRGDEVELAIYFHDAIYDPRKGDNETASAALFSEEAANGTRLGSDGPRRIGDLILATVTHEPSADAATRLLLDLDLSVLGARQEEYAAYALAVRREYAHVPEAAWRLGRCAVLRRFLARKRIYQSAHFAGRCEARARANLLQELASLET